MAEILNSLWTFFVGSVQRWISYLQSLDSHSDQQLVTQEDSKQFPNTEVPHAPFQSYDEASFPYNLSSPSEIKLTGKPEIDAWLRDFAELRIDAYRMIGEAQTLPNAAFLQKRYLQVIKESHPDRPGGNTERATAVNVAKGNLDRLYADPHQQVALFQTVFESYRPPEVTTSPAPLIRKESSSPYIVLWLVGVGTGFVLVLKQKQKQKQRSS